MADTTTFVKIDRNIRGWRWFKNPKTLLVWLWLITSANIEPHDFEHETIQRGEVATSRKSISANTGLTENEVRTALSHLKSTGEITVRLRSKYQVISIVEYNKYQDKPTGKSTGKAPAKHRQSTGKSPQSKNVRKERMEEGKDMCVAHIPSLPEVTEFFQKCGRSQADASKFYSYNSARGWKVGRTPIEDWHSAVDMWIAQGADIGSPSDNDELDDFGRPIRKEFK